jgi:hypothetical protein
VKWDHKLTFLAHPDQLKSFGFSPISMTSIVSRSFQCSIHCLKKLGHANAYAGANNVGAIQKARV